MAQIKHTEEYYIVSVLCREMKYYDGSVATKENTKVWLSGFDDYPSCIGSKHTAKKFKKPPTKEEIDKWDGMPWYYRFIPDSEEIICVEKTTFEPIITETVLIK